MKLILIRHGETEANKKGICQGHKNTVLNEKGKEQARNLARRLKNIKIDYCYTSDLKRACETAEHILKYHKKTKIIKDKRIRERKFGEWEGLPIKEVFKNLDRFDERSKPPKGENFIEIRKRVRKTYKEIIKKYPDKTILIVSHGGALTLLAGLIIEKNFRETRDKLGKIENTGVSEFQIDKNGKYKIIYWNCKKHLDE